MIQKTKNNILSLLVVLLLAANATTLLLFWLHRPQHPAPNRETPAAFLISELKLDSIQQVKLEILRKEHKDSTEALREELREAKDAFFGLLKESNITDSATFAAADEVSAITKKIDLVTFNHFKKVRAICNNEQQKTFDHIIGEVIMMLSTQRNPRMEENKPPPPPPNDHNEKAPMPPPQQEGNMQSPPLMPPSIEERMKRVREIMTQELQPTSAQMSEIEKAFATFFEAEEKLHPHDGPPPAPMDPAARSAMDKLAGDRDVRIKKTLSEKQYKKYIEAELKLRPPNPEERNE